MNKTSVLNQFVQEVKTVSRLPRRAFLLLLGLTVLALVAYSVQAVISAGEPAVAHMEKAISPAANPELFAASRYVRAFDQSLNPELRLAHHYAEIAAQVRAASWTINPELSATNRFAELQTRTAAVSQADNPELMMAARYAASRISDPTFLATNPELIAHLRFNASK